MSKPGLSGEILRILLLGAGLTSIAAVVYLAGPYFAFGTWHPLDNPVIRQIIVVMLIALFAGVAGLRFWTRRKKAQALAQGISGSDAIEDDSEELAARMKDALSTLKRSAGGKGDFLYDLPWYIMIGPPGSGKTTALVNSGLKFPLAGGAQPSAVAGVGGTRYCDWWFTEDAVLIDTAGRYTTQDSDAKGDRQSWFAFLDILKNNRARQPINGVLVAISLQDILMLSPEEIAQHARAIRGRLLELHDRLKIEFPVYALFTKADLVAGFMEFFGNLNEHGRQQVWGATFQTADKKLNLVGEVPAEFDALIGRLNQEMPDRLQDEPAPGTRVALYGFPAQMAALKRPIHDFLNAIFEPTRYHANAALRGFYFTSGTQQGTPIDRLINALVKNFGAREVGAAAYSGLGKSFFLTDLIQKVIIGEAAWVSMDPAAVRRARLIRAAAFAAILAASAAVLGALYVSYSRNGTLAAAVDAAAKEYAATAGPLAHEDIVADHDYDKILPLLQKLRYMPTGYEQKDARVALAATFGLSQFERLQSSSETAYRLALERLFRPRLLFRLEEVLQDRRNDLGYIYNALKVYLMLGGQQPVDRDLVQSWARQDFEELHPGPTQADGRAALLQHLQALIELGAARQPLVEISATIVSDSQKTLARLSLSQRAYELLKSESRGLDIADWHAARAGGADFDRVFEGIGGTDLDAVTVAGFYTYAGFARAFMDRLPGIKERIEKERWVLGSLAEQGTVAEQYKTLPNDLLDLYAKDFVAAWRAALAKLQLKRLTADKPRYVALAAASAATSPLKALFESIRDETALTHERPGFKKDDKATGAGTPNLFADQGQAPGARIETQFRPFHEWVEGDNTRRPIDELIGLLSEIKDNLITSTSVPMQASQANTQLAVEVQRFRSQANRLPDPFKDMMLRAAASFEGDANNSELNQLNKALGEQVSARCQLVVPGKYPFVRGSQNEIGLQEFGLLFAPAPYGLFDKFFQTTLAKYADTSKRDWMWRNDQSIAKSLSATTLKQFQAAAQIRDAFFATGGTMPSFSVEVIPPVLNGTGVTAKLEVNGGAVVTQAGTSVTPQTLQWPGVAAGGRSAVTLGSDQGGLKPAVFEKSGPWSLFRLLDGGAPVQRGDKLLASFLVGGQLLQYQFRVGLANNPLSLPALRDFHCPTNI